MLKRQFQALLLVSSLAALPFTSGMANAAPLETAIFAGGCFWCVESDFDHVAGVVETVSGYSGGSTTENVTYRNHADHREVVKITFDPQKVSYRRLLDIYWRSVDPTDAGGQFCDRGHSYSTAIYATSDAQLKQAKESKAKLNADHVLGSPVATEVAPAGPFFEAEGYHQNYYQKNPIRYKYYRFSCGRDARVEKLWGKDAHMGIDK